MRDAHGKCFETDVVVSDASTDLRSECVTSNVPTSPFLHYVLYV